MIELFVLTKICPSTKHSGFFETFGHGEESPWEQCGSLSLHRGQLMKGGGKPHLCVPPQEKVSSTCSGAPSGSRLWPQQRRCRARCGGGVGSLQLAKSGDFSLDEPVVSRSFGDLNRHALYSRAATPLWIRLLLPELFVILQLAKQGDLRLDVALAVVKEKSMLPSLE